MNLSLQSFLRAGVLGLAVCATGLPLRIEAAEHPVNLEGTWRIAEARDTFEPEGGSIPFTEYGREQYEENRRRHAKKDFDLDYTVSRCASPGLPRLMLTPERFRIWQRPGVVSIQFEWNRLFRQIDLGGLVQPQRRVMMNKENDDLVGRAVPIAKGRWEDDTLVAETRGFSVNTRVDSLVPHGYDMKITERIRQIAPDLLENRITIEDPEYFTRPWETVVTYRRQANEPFLDSVCLGPLFRERERAKP